MWKTCVIHVIIFLFFREHRYVIIEQFVMVTPLP